MNESQTACPPCTLPPEELSKLLHVVKTQLDGMSAADFEEVLWFLFSTSMGSEEMDNSSQEWRKQICYIYMSIVEFFRELEEFKQSLNCA